MQNRLSGVDNGIGLAGDPCAGDHLKLSVEMIVELYSRPLIGSFPV